MASHSNGDKMIGSSRAQVAFLAYILGFL